MVRYFPHLRILDPCSNKFVLTPKSSFVRLEDTLIELYLSGYSNEAQNAASDVAMPMETDHMDSENLSVDGL